MNATQPDAQDEQEPETEGIDRTKIGWWIRKGLRADILFDDPGATPSEEMVYSKRLEEMNESNDPLAKVRKAAEKALPEVKKRAQREYAEAWGLVLRIAENERKLSEWEKVPTPSALELECRNRNIDRLKQEIRNLYLQAKGEEIGERFKDVNDNSLLKELQEEGIEDPRKIAVILKKQGKTLKQIGKLLRQDGEFDSDDACVKRAQRLLAG